MAMVFEVDDEPSRAMPPPLVVWCVLRVFVVSDVPWVSLLLMFLVQPEGPFSSSIRRPNHTPGPRFLVSPCDLRHPPGGRGVGSRLGGGLHGQNRGFRSVSLI